MQNFYSEDSEKINQFSTVETKKCFNIVFPSLPFSLVSVWFKRGSRYDPIGKEGLAHFAEHLFMNQTQRFSNRLTRLKHLESRGIEFNAITTNEVLYFYHIQPKEITIESLDLLLEGLTQSIITQEAIEKEREIVFDEEKRNRDNPWSYIWRICQQTLWPKTPLGRDLFGNKKTISSISLTDVENFGQNFLTIPNATFVITSNENSNILKDHIEKKIILTNNKKVSGLPIEKISLSEPPISLFTEQRDTSDIILAINFRTTSINNTAHCIILHLICEYLANHWISRLLERLRFENDLTYWVNGELQCFSDTGYIRFLFSTKPEKINYAISLIVEEIQKLHQGKIAKDYLNAIKTAYLSILRRKYIDPYMLLNWYGEDATLGAEILSLKEFTERTQKINSKDIVAVAEKYFTFKNFSLVALGPVHKEKIDISGMKIF